MPTKKSFMAFPPKRIVCLTEETVETLYLLGEDHRIVGVSGYAVRPARVRKEKPRVAAFVSADIPRILALEPDLVLTFSDLQAEIVAELIRAGIEVHAFNQRTVAGIFDMIKTLAALLYVQEKGDELISRLQDRLDQTRVRASLLRRCPRIYFEEWDDPMISGIGWVSELVQIAGGDDIFAHLAGHKSARDRIVMPETIIARQPDIIIGSWCGKKFRPEKVATRPGFDIVPAVRNQALHEIKSALILQPGPAALTDGLDELAAIVRNWAERRDPA